MVFEADTRAGRLFDLGLWWRVVASVAVVMLDSVASVHQRWGGWFTAMEWGFTVLFTLGYALRLACVCDPLRCARSVFGVIDRLAIVPTCVALLVPGLHALIDVRVLCLLRILRLLKLTAQVADCGALGRARVASRRKVAVFLSFVLLVVLVMGALMCGAEGPGNGFTSVPISVCGATTPLTTVGFGDITPKPDQGRLIASVMMWLGWGTLAGPTGIVSAEFTAQRLGPHGPTTRTCQACLSAGHLPQACFCRDCGAPLPAYPQH